MPHPSDADEIDLDEHNEAELAGHGISASEVVQVLCNEPLWLRNKKGRAANWCAVGHTNGGRALTIPVLFQPELSQIRPITGWDSTQGERTKYLR